MICEICGKAFVRKASQIKRSQHSYCSNQCRYKGQSVYRRGINAPHYNPELDFACEYCGRICHTKRHKTSNHRFCSRQCKGKWQSQRQIGIDNPAWKGNFSTYHWYGENWKRQRRRARQRDNHTCQRCGITEIELNKALDVHHKKPFFSFISYKQANKLINLISVCHTCHGLLERDNADVPRHPLLPFIR